MITESISTVKERNFAAGRRLDGSIRGNNLIKMADGSGVRERGFCLFDWDFFGSYHVYFPLFHSTGNRFPLTFLEKVHEGS